MTSQSHKTVLLLGASGGIGGALLELLKNKHRELGIGKIIASYRSSEPSNQNEVSEGPEVLWRQLDITDEESVKGICESIETIDWFVNCVGLLHNQSHMPEKSIRQIDPSFFNLNMAVNTQGTLLFAKHLKDKFDKASESIFVSISAKVGSIEDNRLGGWYSYRISKAGLNMALRCIAIEWQRTLPNMRVAAYHPGTTDSELSLPFQKNLPDGQLLDADTSAQHFLQCLLRLHQHPSGQFFSWDEQTLPW